MKTKDQLLSSLRSYEHDLVSYTAVDILYKAMLARGWSKLEKKVFDFIPSESGVSISTYANSVLERRVHYTDIDKRINAIDEQSYNRESGKYEFNFKASCERLQARITNTRKAIETLHLQIGSYEEDSRFVSVRLEYVRKLVKDLKDSSSHLLDEQEYKLLQGF